MQHARGRAILAPYQLGSSDSAAEHRLLADRFGHALEVGLALDDGQLLATQPSELAAAVEILGAERARQLIEHKSPSRAGPTSARSTPDSSAAGNWSPSSRAGSTTP